MCGKFAPLLFRRMLLRFRAEQTVCNFVLHQCVFNSRHSSLLFVTVQQPANFFRYVVLVVAQVSPILAVTNEQRQKIRYFLPAGRMRPSRERHAWIGALRECFREFRRWPFLMLPERCDKLRYNPARRRSRGNRDNRSSPNCFLAPETRR